MKVITLWILLVVALVVAGCDLETEGPGKPQFNPANHLVINEVFVLPFTNQNFFSWIELYNPTQDTIDLRNWKLSFRAPKARFLGLLFKDTVRVNGVLQMQYVGFQVTFLADSVGAVTDFPFTGSSRVKLKPNELYTMVSDEHRLKVFTDVGPVPGPKVNYTQFLEGPQDTVLIPDITPPDTIRWSGVVFYINPTEQIVLRDSAGTAVDVVRFGNYVYPGPGPDPYPNNKSFGMIKDYESIARYAGAYSTGNTANDFYQTGPGLRPIPHYYSQAYKK